MPIAIITGASSGLGLAFFDAIARQCPEVDEFWLIARRKDLLEQAAERAPSVKAVPLPLDLTAEKDLAVFSQILQERRPDVRLLVNNAGFGKLGAFCDSQPDSQAAMTQLNVTALVEMTALCLPFMGPGALIINVSSIASFAPTPGMAVYGGTKAFVTSFTKSLHRELSDRDIGAIAVCPGPMDTGFNAVAGIGGGASPTFEGLPKEKPQDIAQGAVRAGLRGRAVYTGRIFYKLYRVLTKLMPHSLIVCFSDLRRR